MTIAGKRIQGVTFQHIILDDIRNNMNSSLDRIHLTCRKDIANIERAYGLREAQYHKDDATSVWVWIETMKKHNPTTVLLFKQQSEMTTSDWRKVTSYLYCRCHYKLKFILDLIYKIICIDDTHGTNSYDFHHCSYC